MFKRTIAALTVLVAMLCFAVKVDAADGYTKDDTWLIYWYICGADDLEGEYRKATSAIAEMQQAKLPPNVKVLIAAGNTKKWHHPTIKAGGHGIYLYSANHFSKQVNWNTNINKPDTNMGNLNTLASFLKYGEKNFAADHKILIFSNHGGLSGVCYDDSFKKDGLTYDELKKALSSVYGNSPEKVPFEFIGFDACTTGSYELANTLSGFSHYMLGSEPNSNGWAFGAFFGAIAKDPSMNGAQIGKVICDSAMKMYEELNLLKRHDNALSVIDLTKMPELREAYESYFDEAVKRADKEAGFSVAFARAANARNVDKYANMYADLGLIAKNTKAIMPDASDKLLKAIDKAVVYNKRGAYLKSKGMSTYYPYISSEKIFSKIGSQKDVNSRDKNFEIISKQNSSYAAQKEFYSELLSLDVSNLQGGNVPVERNSKGHLTAKLTPEQMENVSSIKGVLFPLDKSGKYDFGGAILFSADDLKIDWNKGTVTEKFCAVEPLLEGQKIVMYPSVSGRGHTFYSVPVLLEGTQQHLLVRYDTSAKKYEIVGFGSNVENGVVRTLKINAGDIITPLYITISSDPSNTVIGLTGYTKLNEKTKKQENIPLMSIIDSMNVPNTNEKLFFKWKAGTPFVYTRNSTITNKPINRGIYFYSFMFNAPNGDSAASSPGVIVVKNGQILRLTTEEFAEAVAYAQ